MNEYKVFFEYDGKKKCKTVHEDCPLDASDAVVAEYPFANIHEVRLIKSGGNNWDDLLPKGWKDLFGGKI